MDKELLSLLNSLRNYLNKGDYKGAEKFMDEKIAELENSFH